MGQKRPTAAVPRLGAHKNNFSGGASKDGCLNPSTRPHGRVLGPRFTTDGCQERPTFTHRSAGEASPTLKAPTTATSSRTPWTATAGGEPTKATVPTSRDSQAYPDVPQNEADPLTASMNPDRIPTDQWALPGPPSSCWDHLRPPKPVTPFCYAIVRCRALRQPVQPTCNSARSAPGRNGHQGSRASARSSAPGPRRASFPSWTCEFDSRRPLQHQSVITVNGSHQSGRKKPDSQSRRAASEWVRSTGTHGRGGREYWLADDVYSVIEAPMTVEPNG